MTNRMSLPFVLMFAVVLAGCSEVSAQPSGSSLVSSTLSLSGCLASTDGEGASAERVECKAFTSTPYSSFEKRR